MSIGVSSSGKERLDPHYVRHRSEGVDRARRSFSESNHTAVRPYLLSKHLLRPARDYARERDRAPLFAPRGIGLSLRRHTPSRLCAYAWKCPECRRVIFFCTNRARRSHREHENTCIGLKFHLQISGLQSFSLLFFVSFPK